MKKTFLLLSFMILAGSFYSCDKLKNKLDQKSYMPGRSTADTGDDSRDIINFNNNLIRMNDEHQKLFKQFSSDLNRAEGTIELILSKGDSSAIHFPILPVAHTFYAKHLEAPKILGTGFQTRVDQIVADFTDLKALHKDLMDYMTRSDWNKDEGKEFFALQEEVDSLFMHHAQIIYELFSDIQKSADEAEEKILKTHPLRKQIIQSREILEYIENIVDESYEFENLEEYLIQFDEQYKELEAMYEKNKTMKIPNSYKNKINSFEVYNNSVADFLSKMSLARLELACKSDKIDNRLDKLEDTAEYVRKNYNRFVM